MPVHRSFKNVTAWHIRLHIFSILVVQEKPGMKGEPTSQTDSTESNRDRRSYRHPELIHAIYDRLGATHSLPPDCIPLMKIVESYDERLRNYIYRLARGPDIAEELKQDVWALFIKKLVKRKINPDILFPNWLFKTAKYLFFKWYQKEVKRYADDKEISELEEEATQKFELCLGSPQHSLDDESDLSENNLASQTKRDQLAKLQEYIKRLKPNKRAFFEITFQTGDDPLTSQQIAETLYTMGHKQMNGDAVRKQKERLITDIRKNLM
jgi:RNA polymerase sigma factor (sigma-70 family)